VGIEPSGHSHWFERLLAELSYPPWMGDPAQRVRKKKNDRKDGDQVRTGKRGFPSFSRLPQIDGGHYCAS
jgi:hypothetical protein